VRRARQHGNGLDAWPGYVDALSTLLMVLIFVLLVFVLAQGFLSVALAGRNTALTEASRRLAQQSAANLELSQKSETQAQSLAKTLAELSDTQARLRAAAALRDTLGAQLQQAQRDAAQSATETASLSRQLAAVQESLQQVNAALAAAKLAGAGKDQQIASLGQKLNEALTAKVEELQHYRSEFFGRLRDVLAGKPGIQVVGDRFVFQSEVLFPVNSADMTPAGEAQIRALAATVKQIGNEIPATLPWLLRVDGHADKQKIQHGKFTDNWALSAARAIAVVKLLISQGVPPEHLAATGFGDNQPLDMADTQAAYAKNRRIELRLTDR
jgi:chemotaxis protein MotB